MAVLTVTPSPALVSSVVSVDGTGFNNRRVRLLLDGKGATNNVFRASKSGTFGVGIQVSSVAKTQVLAAEQLQPTGVWLEVARLSIVVKVAVTVPPPTGPVAAKVGPVYLSETNKLRATPPNGTDRVVHALKLHPIIQEAAEARAVQAAILDQSGHLSDVYDATLRKYGIDPDDIRQAEIKRTSPYPQTPAQDVMGWYKSDITSAEDELSHHDVLMNDWPTYCGGSHATNAAGRQYSIMLFANKGTLPDS